LREDLLRKFRVEKRERRNWGRNNRTMVTVRLRATSSKAKKVKATKNPLNTSPQKEARKASINFPLRRPSRGPPGAMGLATPFLRHLARPRVAEMMEMK